VFTVKVFTVKQGDTYKSGKRAEMKKRWWLWIVLTPAVFMLIGAGRAYATGSFEAYTQALAYGLKGLKAYLDFIVELFKTL